MAGLRLRKVFRVWSERGVLLGSPPTQTVRELLENPVQPINDMSYFGCLDSVMENSKVSAAGNPGGQGRNCNYPGVALPH